MYFELVLPKRVIFKRGSLSNQEIEKEIRRLGKKPLFVCGKNYSKKITRNIVNLIKEATVYEDISPEPTVLVLSEVLEFARKNEVDVVVSIGGGSVLDVGKATAGLFYENGGVEDYLEGKNVEKRGLPYIAIPTVSGSGAEATYNSVIKIRNTKKSIRSPTFIAELIIIDPGVTLEVSPYQTAISAADALIHSLEAFLSVKSNPLTDTLALFAISIIFKNIVKVVNNPKDIEAREKIAEGSLLGGIVLANAGLGAIHGLAAPFGALFSLPHGLACALLTPYILEYNLDLCFDKYKKIQEVIGREEESLPQILNNLFEEIGLPKLKEIKIKEEELDFIINNASSSIKYNPKKINSFELKEILKRDL
jgi:alcohol dehydrogenase